MWESVKSGDGFRLVGSGLARGAAPSTDYEGNLCLNEELGMVVRRQILRLSSHCSAFTFSNIRHFTPLRMTKCAAEYKS